MASEDEKAVGALPHQLVDAMNARDLDGIMAVYVPDESLFVFDTMPPRAFVGARAYRDAFAGLLAAFPGPTTYTVLEPAVIADDKLGWVHWVCNMRGTAKDGSTAEMNFRLTSCARKVGGKWLVLHEHVSFPVNLTTGQADFLAQP
ncbi:MAG: nuclear transport factor 2 family protein [Candidatus Binatia bacterium]